MRRAFFGFLAVLLGFLTALSWYGWERGFSKKWRTYLAQQFHRQGLEVSVRRLTLDPFRGLVAHEMKIYDPDNRRRVLAMIDQVNLGVNYARVLRGKALLDSVEMRDTKVSLPLDPGDLRGANATISHLSARIFFPPRQIYLSHAEAEIYGLRVSATGRVVKPRNVSVGGGGRSAPGALLASAAGELKAMRYEGERPAVQIEFSGDLSRPDHLAASLRLHATAVRRRKYLLRRLDLVANCGEGSAELQQLDASDARGELHARGAYVFASGEFEGSLRSSLDLQELNRAIRVFEHPEILLHDPPRVELTVQGVLGRQPSFQAVGHLGLGNFAVKSETFSSLSTDVSWDGDRWSVRDLRLEHRTGGLSADAMQLPQKFRASIRSTIDPRAFLPLLGGKAADWLAQFEFGDNTLIDLEVAGPSVTSSGCRAAGEILFGQSSFRDRPVRGVSRLTYSNRALTIRPFPGGGEDGAAVFDFEHDEVRIETARPQPAPETDASLAEGASN